MSLKSQAIKEGALPVPTGSGWVRRERGEQFTFTNVGDMIQGTLVSKDTTEIGGSTVGRYVIRTSDGDRVVIGSTVLDDLLRSVRGQVDVAIRYDGDVPTRTGQALRMFTVWTRPLSDRRV